MAPPSVLLLDALGTLLELRPPAPALRGELSRRFGVEVSEREAERALAAEIAYYRSHLQDGRDAPSLGDLRRRCAEVLRDALPPSPRLSGVPVSELTGALLDSLRFEPFADAPPALAAARRRGLRLFVVSNWDFSLHDVLGRAGLARALDGILTSAEVGARKPDPLIFARALECAGVSADAALHVGDSMAEDVAGARAAGVPVLLLRRDGAAGPDGVPTIRSLAELCTSDRGLGPRLTT